MAVNLDTTSQVACKIVNLRAVKEIAPKLGDNQLQKQEVAILQKLCHVRWTIFDDCIEYD